MVEVVRFRYRVTTAHRNLKHAVSQEVLVREVVLLEVNLLVGDNVTIATSGGGQDASVRAQAQGEMGHLPSAPEN